MPGSLEGIRGQREAGGKVVGAASGNVTQGRRGREAHDPSDRLVEGTVSAAADNPVKIASFRLHNFGGMARIGGAAHRNQIALLAEMSHRVEHGCRRARAARPGVDDE